MTTTTWSPTDKTTGITLAEGNLLAINDSGSNKSLIRATNPTVAAVKSYFEVVVVQLTGAGGTYAVGLANAAASLSQWLGQNADGWGYWNSGSRYHNNGATAGYATYTTGDIIGVARNGAKMWFSKNNVWQGGGDPAADTSPAYSNLSGDLYPALSPFASVARGRGLFATGYLTYTPPSGFSPLGVTPPKQRLLTIGGRAAELPESTMAGRLFGEDIKGLNPTEIRTLLALGALAQLDTVAAAQIGTDAVTTVKIIDGAVSLAKQANLAAGRAIGRAASSGTGVPVALTEAQQAANILTAASVVFWTAPTLLNSWVNAGAPNEVAGYRKDPSTGIVYVKGLVKDGVTTTSTPILTLPAGFRPAATFTYPILTATGTTWDVGRIRITSAGSLELMSHSGSDFVMLNCVFWTG